MIAKMRLTVEKKIFFQSLSESADKDIEELRYATTAVISRSP